MTKVEESYAPISVSGIEVHTEVPTVAPDSNVVYHPRLRSLTRGLPLLVTPVPAVRVPLTWSFIAYSLTAYSNACFSFFFSLFWPLTSMQQEAIDCTFPCYAFVFVTSIDALRACHLFTIRSMQYIIRLRPSHWSFLLVDCVPGKFNEFTQIKYCSDDTVARLGAGRFFNLCEALGRGSLSTWRKSIIESPPNILWRCVFWSSEVILDLYATRYLAIV